MTDTAPTPGPTPYSATALQYHKAGWAPLPLPHEQKAPVPRGFTGNDGAWPSGADVYAWTEDPHSGNVGLRLPPTVLGIDVDHYGAKPGGAVLTHLEAQLGALPPTWRSTSRDDGQSGIRLFRVPPGLRWPGALGPGIDTIRHEHRYTVAPPSVHPEGGTYRWITPDGAVALHDIPNVDDLPELPAAWVEHFTAGELAAVDERVGDPEAHAWARTWAAGAPCPRIAYATAEALVTVRGDRGARHDAALTAINRIVWQAGEGHVGATQALGELRRAFTASVTERADVDAEFDRMVAGAYRIAAAAHPTIPTTDPCVDPFHGLIDRSTTPCSQPSSTTPPSSGGTPPAPPTGPSADSPVGTFPTPTAGPTAGSAATASPLPTPMSSCDSPPSPAGTSSPAPGVTTSTSTSLAPSSPADTAGSPAATAPTSAVDADDAYEADRTRLLLRDQELERLRARRDATRLLDTEDTDGVIQDRVRSLHLQDEARRVYRREAAGAQEPPEGVTLTDLLATPDDPVKYRVADLWPAGGRVVLAAQAKAGKSTTVTNLVRSLVDGDLFLGTFAVNPPPGRVVVIDNELDPRQIKANYRGQGIRNTDMVQVVPLRGKVATFDILDPVIRAEWAEKLQGASVVIFDCLRPLIDALALSEDKDAGRVLVAFDALLNDAGVDEGLVVHHMGHNGERARGDTRIRDWPDAEWKIVKQATEEGKNDDAAERFFSAFGRDVHVTEQQVELEPDTPRLYLAGGTREEAKLRPALDAVLDVVRGSTGGATGNQIETWLQDSGHTRNTIRKAYKYGVHKGVLEASQGDRRSIVYTIGISTQVSNRQNARGGVANWPTGSPPLPVGGGAPANSRPDPNRQFATDNRRTETRPLCGCGSPLPADRELIGSRLCYACSPIQGVDHTTGEVQ